VLLLRRAYNGTHPSDGDGGLAGVLPGMREAFRMKAWWLIFDALWAIPLVIGAPLWAVAVGLVANLIGFAQGYLAERTP
jgi:hypothetical protein